MKRSVSLNCLIWIKIQRPETKIHVRMGEGRNLISVEALLCTKSLVNHFTMLIHFIFITNLWHLLFPPHFYLWENSDAIRIHAVIVILRGWNSQSGFCLKFPLLRWFTAREQAKGTELWHRAETLRWAYGSSSVRQRCSPTLEPDTTPSEQ